MAIHPAIRVRRVTKRYGPVTAVNSLNLTVWRGEVHGFIGRNGLARPPPLLLGLMRPAAGEVRIHGNPAIHSATDWLARVGCLVEPPPPRI